MSFLLFVDVSVTLGDTEIGNKLAAVDLNAKSRCGETKFYGIEKGEEDRRDDDAERFLGKGLYHVTKIIYVCDVNPFSCTLIAH